MFHKIVSQLSEGTKDLVYQVLDAYDISPSPTPEEITEAMNAVVQQVKQELQRTGDLKPDEEALLDQLPSTASELF